MNQKNMNSVLRFAGILLISNLWACVALPQQPDVSAQGMVRLKLDGEISLGRFAEYVGQRIGLRILYDQTVGQKKIFIQAPDDVPVSSLYEVLQSVLKIEGFTIAESEVQGWRRIVPVAQLPQVARTTPVDGQLEDAGPAEPITQVFVLENASPMEVATAISKFLTPAGSNVETLSEQRALIVTDVAENIRRVRDLIEILDQTKPAARIKFVPVVNLRASEVSLQLSEILASRAKVIGRSAEDSVGVEISADLRTNQLIMVGRPSDILEAETLLKALDTALPTEPVAYPIRYASPVQLSKSVEALVEAQSIRPPFQSRSEGGSLVIDTTRDMHQQIRNLLLRLDSQDAPSEQSPVRFYKIKNVPVVDLLDTLLGIQSGQSGSASQSPATRRLTRNDAALAGPNQPSLIDPTNPQPINNLPPPPVYQPSVNTQPGFDTSLPNIGRNFPIDGAGVYGDDRNFENDRQLLPGPAQVSADINSNSLIIVGSPEVQRVYANLIESLDQRRPQVMVEAKVVIVDTSDNYTLGVELSAGDRLGGRRAFSFSSFGLSTPNAVSGALQVIPGVGFNGTLVDPSTADAVVRALTNHRRAKVVSTPKILVDDNAEGQLTSVAEVPFTSVNASDTVATTSFAGFADAGTTITVTPTISDDDYLQLDYIVTLNSFTGTGADGIPPPRQTNEVRSRVTIPDGYTVIVGGLNQKDAANETTGIPWLEKIPLIKEVTSLQTERFQETSLFVFLRPVILREDKFRDLKHLSDVDTRRAEVGRNYPAFCPLEVR